MVCGLHMNELILDMECYAKEANIPIMLKEGIDYLVNFIKENNIKSVLEIGTAIGYSAINMGASGAKVVTIERDVNRYKLAVKNVSKADMNDKISLILADAFDTEISSKFDMILIDAAKGQNKRFIEKFRKNLKKGSFIIIDNVNFHGLVGNSESIKSKNLRSLVRKIENFLEYLDNQNDFIVTKVNVGDGLIILREVNYE